MRRIALASIAAALGLVMSAGDARATSDQLCFEYVHGYDPVSKLLWKKTVCEACTTDAYRADVTSKRKRFRKARARTKRDPDSDERCISRLRSKADRESYARAAAHTLTSLPPSELSLKSKWDGEDGSKAPVTINGPHIQKTRVTLELASEPGIEAAWLIPSTTWGLVEVRYATSLYCCPYRGRQKFAFFRYKPKAQTVAKAEFRVGPDYLALRVDNKTRHQISMPSGCGHHKTKGKSAKQFPFEIPCKKGAPLTVTRKTDHIAMSRGIPEVGRIHVPPATTIAIQGEQLVRNGYDGMAYTVERVVCTYGGRCTATTDNYLNEELPGPNRVFCAAETCILVPKRDRKANIVVLRDDDEGARVAPQPTLKKRERITALTEEDDKLYLVIKHRKTVRKALLKPTHDNE